MSYGLFLLHICGIQDNNTSRTETIKINFIIFCYHFFSQVHVSMDLTLTHYNKSYKSLNRCGESFIWLFLFFSVDYLQVTTQKPITWKMAQWLQAPTTSRYVFFFSFFLTLFSLFFLRLLFNNELFLKLPTQPLLLLLAFSF